VGTLALCPPHEASASVEQTRHRFFRGGAADGLRDRDAIGSVRILRALRTRSGMDFYLKTAPGAQELRCLGRIASPAPKRNLVMPLAAAAQKSLTIWRAMIAEK